MNLLRGIIAIFYKSFIVLSILPKEAFLYTDAIVKALYRMFVSHKNLLNWITSEEAEKMTKNTLPSYFANFKANIITSEDLEQIPNANFDLITMWHVLEHVDDLKWQVEQLQRLVKFQGRIVIAVPNYKSYDAQFYKELWAAYDVPRHLNHFNKTTITKIFKSKGLELKKTEKLIWDAYYISYMSEQYKHHSLPLIKGAFRGFISNCKARRSGEWSSMVYVFEKNSEN